MPFKKWQFVDLCKMTLSLQLSFGAQTVPDSVTAATSVRGFKSLPLQSFSLHAGRKGEKKGIHFV